MTTASNAPAAIDRPAIAAAAIDAGRMADLVTLGGNVLAVIVWNADAPTAVAVVTIDGGAANGDAGTSTIEIGPYYLPAAWANDADTCGRDIVATTPDAIAAAAIDYAATIPTD